MQFSYSAKFSYNLKFPADKNIVHTYDYIIEKYIIFSDRNNGEFNKYLYFYDIPNNLYSSILSIDGCNGLYINSTEYREFFNTNNIIASKFLQFILQDTKKILINVNKSDIIKYQQENLLLVCE